MSETKNLPVPVEDARFLVSAKEVYRTPAVLKDYEAAGALIERCGNNVAALNGLADKFNGLSAVIAKLVGQFDEASKDSRTATLLFHRTVYRLGIVLREIPTQNGKRTDIKSDGPPTRTQVITDAGISEDRRRAALDLAEIPPDEFRVLVEDEIDPPTLERLRKKGAALRKAREATPPPRRAAARGARGAPVPAIFTMHNRKEITTAERDEIAALRKREQKTLAKKGPAAVKAKAATLVEQREQQRQERKKRAAENAEKAKEILRRIMADLSAETIRYAGENWTWEVHLYVHHLQQAIDEAYRKMKHGSAA